MIIKRYKKYYYIINNNIIMSFNIFAENDNGDSHHLRCDNNGLLKVDIGSLGSGLATEATLTSLLNIINNSLIPALFLALNGLSNQLNDISNNTPKTIQQHRADGNVYVLSTPFNTSAILYFHNPSASGVNAYIYNITLSTQNDCNIKIYKCDNVFTVQDGDYSNLDFSSSNTSNMKWDRSGNILSNEIQIAYLYCDTGGTTVVNDFKESFIKITPGTTIAFVGSATISVAIEWIETAENI